MSRTILGIERVNEFKSLFENKKVGLITNPTGIDGNFKSSIDILREQTNLTGLFSPEHGVRASIQAGQHLETYIDDETGQAMMQLPDPFGLVEPILDIIGTNPNVDFGMPGELVRFVESFYKKGYEELLIASVKKNPTEHNIWMVHRCYNDINNPMREQFKALVEELKADSCVSEDIKTAIDDFNW